LSGIRQFCEFGYDAGIVDHDAGFILDPRVSFERIFAHPDEMSGTEPAAPHEGAKGKRTWQAVVKPASSDEEVFSPQESCDRAIPELPVRFRPSRIADLGIARMTMRFVKAAKTQSEMRREQAAEGSQSKPMTPRAPLLRHAAF
jgi:hypothetical protein